jgi:hypothetical protein
MIAAVGTDAGYSNRDVGSRGPDAAIKRGLRDVVRQVSIVSHG